MLSTRRGKDRTANSLRTFPWAVCKEKELVQLHLSGVRESGEAHLRWGLMKCMFRWVETCERVFVDERNKKAWVVLRNQSVSLTEQNAEGKLQA